ncbi:MAG: ribosome biogenesis/translation initiation ATPase RLI [Cenarchaeum sp. SB0663_bin_5]|nr:ribosome biogenesis/translation initiation ATPase RLI [Cenarchaeum sp. SB0663_bin_5]MYH04285.1 ribosome biogenesis/translation initiation ATPase RLI [Cenarchaeum sp. SB0675_bin_21]MYL10772.1 ribosome biogenesis/translation initiation ATPase RLI [Cenarchaeum sp. SB0669_bin_11]
MTHRVAVLDSDLCQPRKCGLECIKYCPVNKSGADCIVLDEGEKKAQIDEDICNGCGICVKVCPFDAITIVNLASELKTDKIHQYDQNSFRLYRLPTPRKGEVVGLLGRNGMGKSTVVNILSGGLIPNLGDYETDPSWDGIIKHFAGTELKQHFESIRDGNIVSSIKPQQVHRVASAFNGTGKDLIEQFDQRGVGRQMIQELDLTNAIHQPLNELSGGELQRISIAVAACKKADFYFFDEPSSYNDIFQRTGVARVIQSLANAGSSVMVVEHDLTLLDFLSDYIEVLYGEPGAYGIVSNVLSTKVGINVFLDGYLPQENVRFREKKFTFVASSSSDDFTNSPPMVEYTDITKKYESFSLSVHSGMVRKGEILGIMGANALGKTTFMKILAGVEESDSGTVTGDIKLSYKPQYLQADTDMEVSELLSRTIDGTIEGSDEEERIVYPLRVTKLYTKKINSLSGGELQKVAVAASLLRKADLYCLDEPSAFLDVEDRIAVAKFIQKFVRSFGKSAVIIDHDLQLMDLVSDRIVIFEGESGRSGIAHPPTTKSDAMNKFLETLNISFRRDEKSMRPRVNKTNSRLDKQQKANGTFYLSR